MRTAINQHRRFGKPEMQRAMGLLVGAAVGDALGAPFEFEEAGKYAARFPERVLDGRAEMIGGGGFGWAPGEFTDDTQMGLALAETLMRTNAYDADEVWHWFRTWARTANDVGNRTASSLVYEDWRDVPRGAANGAGNGALMRAFPLALAFLDAATDVRRDVVLHQAALTHPDPAAGWGAWLAVEMMCTAVRGEEPFAALDACLTLLPADQHEVFAPLLHTSWEPFTSTVRNGTVWGCLAQAVWALRSTSSYEEAVVAAVNLGDDADTVACVAGALAGARYGVQAVPSRWATYVHGAIDSPVGRLEYRMEDLHAVARGLLGKVTDPETPMERSAGPQAVAPLLHAADLGGAAQAPTDWAIVSLCRTGERFFDHEHRRQLYLRDEEPLEENIGLGHAVLDAVDAVDAFLAAGRNVVVHCHGGRSRTGLVLKAWAMRRFGYDERDAHLWLSSKWFRYADYNETFVDFLRNEWKPLAGS